MTEQANSSKKKSLRSVYIGGIVLLVVAVLLIVVITSLKKSNIEAETKSRVETVDAGPHVRVVHIINSPAEHSVILEGDARPYASVTLYAKISGYLKTIKTDKGENVREGQLLGVIESPETDRAYQATLADAKNKEAIAKRNRDLLAQQLISPQAAEQSDADAEVAKQNLAVIQEQKSYEVIRAPFSGTVTARYADPGALMQNAATSQTSALPIVALAQLDRLRIDVYLDQRYAPYVHDGDSVEVTVLDQPGLLVNARVTRYTGELDPVTRQLLVEIEVPNKARKIVPGSTVEVRLRVATPSTMQIPSTALVIRGKKYFVPIVGTDNRITFREIHVGENDGDNIQVIDGLKGDELIALNLGETIVEGSKIQPVLTPEATPTASQHPPTPAPSGKR